MAEKVIFFMQRAAGLDRAGFQRRYLESHAPLVLRHCPRVRGYTVNLIDSDRENSDPEMGELDAVTEMWFDAIEDFTDPARFFDSSEGRAAVERDGKQLVGRVHAYRVEEGVQRDYERAWPEGERSPGMKVISALRRAPALSHDQFADHWLHTHVALALEHVLGMWRYVTNVVTAPITPDAPPIDGVVSVHYLEKRRFGSPEGEAIMAADVASFLSPPGRLRAVEYVLRARQADA
jgi:uncharacterized protein (TIGR02118 family)